ncbi:hypothetical protein GCM10027280_06560 [Micromonospora polyrhachis]|uniref:Uncharacterized protein n=1 Tax=Micromonospora polyrhachis TaxID=1282883 RepID=A0A7W7WMR8_9ACTN|nr:hypothetical protein [Micromonospora polyrhachis]MBB4956433.1 hypothetical protein [Micromonospora polyrhachis]
MGEVLAPVQRVPLPSFWGRPQPDRAVPAGQHVTRYLRQATQVVGAAVARILPDAGSRVPVLNWGPWESPGSVTPGPAGWFALVVEADRSGFRLGGRPMVAADLARAIWHCPRWRGRPVLLVTQASAPADGAGPVLRQLAVDLGAPVYASDAGIRFTFGRAFADGQFWCWHPNGADEPGLAGRLLPPLGPVRARRTPPGQSPSPLPPGVPAEPVPPPVANHPAIAPPPAAPAAIQSSVAVPGLEPGRPSELETAHLVRGLTVPVIEVPQPDFGLRRIVLPEFPPPRLELDTHRPLDTIVAAGTTDSQAPATDTPATVAAMPAAVTVVPPSSPDTADTPGGGGAAGPPSVSPAARREAAWLGVRARTEEADRERLRVVLGWKFQAHSRAVVRALSLHPGLRNAVGAHDVMAGLVAVLALLDGMRERVDDTLRGGTPDEDVQLLARCACAGLVQLPAIGGPVFAAVPDGLEVTDRYRPGDLVVEPGFTTVSLTGGTVGTGTGTGTGGGGGGGTGGGGGAGRYAIWSATARRLDQLGIPGAQVGQAMFAAGTRFAVLGVDDGPDGAPCVLLREIVFEHRGGALDERVAGKLRDALAAQAPRAAPAPLPWPLGFAASDRPFALQLDPAGALRDDPSGPARPAPVSPGSDSHEGVVP